jgi:hypothetical protein
LLTFINIFIKKEINKEIILTEFLSKQVKVFVGFTGRAHNARRGEKPVVVLLDV